MDSHKLAKRLEETVSGCPWQNKTCFYVVFGIKYGAELQVWLHQVVDLAQQTQWRSAIFDGAEGGLYFGMGLAALVQVRERSG